VDDPILDSNENATGLYHVAGPYCPEESLVQMCLPDYERQQIGTATAADEQYRKSVVESYGVCSVHTEAPVVEEPVETETPSEGDPTYTPGQTLPLVPEDGPGTAPDDTTDLPLEEPANPTVPEPDIPASGDSGETGTP
jgi:penicillin-binding protein 1A